MDDSISTRGLFIIDADGIIQHVTINNLPVGRNVDETLRLIAAFKHVQANPNEVCPMNWTPGDKTMNPDPEKSQDYFKDIKKNIYVLQILEPHFLTTHYFHISEYTHVSRRLKLKLVKTQCQDEFRSLSGCVPEILTACRMLQISIAWCQNDAEIRGFPTMYINGGG